MKVARRKRERRSPRGVARQRPAGRRKKCGARLYAGFCAPGSPPAWPPLLWAAGHPDGSMPPTRQLSGTTSKLAYLVLLRAEIARFTPEDLRLRDSSLLLW